MEKIELNMYNNYKKEIMKIINLNYYNICLYKEELQYNFSPYDIMLKNILQYPSRGRFCNHFQCFDLECFLKISSNK